MGLIFGFIQISDDFTETATASATSRQVVCANKEIRRSGF
jgi:hypothetical protein